METSFSNILIPVDFSQNTDLAVQKAIQLADPAGSVIHLFHVAKSAFQLNGYSLNGDTNTPVFNPWYSGEIEMQLEPFKQTIQNSVPTAEVNTHMLAGGTIQQGIIEMASQLNAQLIIIGKTNNHRWFSFSNSADASFIAKKTHCAVLTVRPGAVHSRIRSIVLPVRSFVPERKIQLLAALTRKNKPAVHLVSMSNENMETSVAIETYRTISHYMDYPVEYKVLEGKNFPKAILDYAKYVNADMLLTNPYAETKTNLLFGTDICDLITPGSKLCILTAEPFANLTSHFFGNPATKAVIN